MLYALRLKKLTFWISCSAGLIVNSTVAEIINGPGTYRGLPLANPQIAILPADTNPNFQYWTQQVQSKTIQASSFKSISAKTHFTSSNIGNVIYEDELPTLIGQNDIAGNAQSIDVIYGQAAAIYGTLYVPATPQQFTLEFAIAEESLMKSIDQV